MRFWGWNSQWSIVNGQWTMVYRQKQNNVANVQVSDTTKLIKVI
jgi:plasmid maintenance system killer protein